MATYRHGNLEHLTPSATLQSGGRRCAPLDARWRNIRGRIHARRPLCRKLIKELVQDIKENTVDEETIGAFLMSVCLFGISKSDVTLLTEFMAKSGATYDYRQLSELRSKTSLRRYPSGALSEKVALLMPSVISVLSDELSIYSPFLVARSLSYTGGTWDKLSAIPGFSFPKPGEETIQCLTECGVAITVTTGDFNPVDRKLYQLRSLTGTAENDALIVSSIVSKQIAVPVDYALMDIRYGQGAFIKGFAHAERVGIDIRDAMESNGIKTLYTLTDTQEPNGSAIGNALEVSEAIEILQHCHTGVFDQRGIVQQKLILVDFMAKLLGFAFPRKTAGEWGRYCWNLMQDGKLWKGFKKILRAHKVAESEIRKAEASATYLIDGRPHVSVKARQSGQFRSIDQERLGWLVNFELGGGGNEYGYERDLYAGVILKARVGDYVERGSELAIMIGTKANANTADEALKCFEIG